MLDYLRHLVTEEGMTELFQAFEAFGIFSGFFLVLLESFIPILPLFVIVVLNINSFGFILGVLISYAASVSGSYILFIIIRNLFRRRAQQYIRKRRQLRKWLDFLNRNSFMFLFIMLALPFTPTSLMNVLAAIADIKRVAYLYILLGAKLFMILSMAAVGYDVAGFFSSPSRLILSALLLVALYFISKWYQQYVRKKIQG
ncbi:MAG TPA: VTT domain-containing protein [Aliicoccus persicus]|uniref:TVP38/TMEM64 family membrane protein n=1 Tax=Aliicoccus persicus TaxID=930138 RepID=A0A921DYS6_9STAP|nr:VTT domain-containing protein [Aliicoccus persicus]